MRGGCLSDELGRRGVVLQQVERVLVAALREYIHLAEVEAAEAGHRWPHEEGDLMLGALQLEAFGASDLFGAEEGGEEFGSVEAWPERFEAAGDDTPPREAGIEPFVDAEVGRDAEVDG